MTLCWIVIRYMTPLLVLPMLGHDFRQDTLLQNAANRTDIMSSEEIITRIKDRISQKSAEVRSVFQKYDKRHRGKISKTLFREVSVPFFSVAHCTNSRCISLFTVPAPGGFRLHCVQRTVSRTVLQTSVPRRAYDLYWLCEELWGPSHGRVCRGPAED